MMIAELFGLEELFFIEPSYDRLIESIYTDKFLALGTAGGRVLIDMEDVPMAVAGKADKWKAICLLHRDPSDALIEAVEEMELEIFQTSREEFTGAVREYYSVLLAETVKPAIEDFSAQRAEQVRSLLQQVFSKSKLKGRTCLDVGCGSGLGSAALHELGMNVIAYDTDASLLSRGLAEGRLHHHETMKIDATRAMEYIDPVRYGLVLMAGKINEFNSVLWKKIITEAFELSETTLITLETEKEARMVEKWCPLGRKTEVFENNRDPFYDRWVVVAKS